MDGTEIERVRFEITDPTGNIFVHSEVNPPYCLFQNADGRCDLEFRCQGD